MEIDRLLLKAVSLLPRHSLSRAMGSISKAQSRMAVRRFVAAYGVDMSEAEKPLEDYYSIHDVFTRQLKAGVRPVDLRTGVCVAPVDGQLSMSCEVKTGELPQAKGWTYRIEDLLVDDHAVEVFGGGYMWTIYLSPRGYHRVHSPVDGFLERWVYVPGDLYPVNAAAVKSVDSVFTRNERLITYIRSPEWGRVAVVKIGATIVGRISASYASICSEHSSRSKKDIRKGYLEPPPHILRGDELAVFELGSTVILLVERPCESLCERGGMIKMGQGFAALA